MTSSGVSSSIFSAVIGRLSRRKDGVRTISIPVETVKYPDQDFIHYHFVSRDYVICPGCIMEVYNRYKVADEEHSEVVREYIAAAGFFTSGEYVPCCERCTETRDMFCSALSAFYIVAREGPGHGYHSQGNIEKVEALIQALAKYLRGHALDDNEISPHVNVARLARIKRAQAIKWRTRGTNLTTILGSFSRYRSPNKRNDYYKQMPSTGDNESTFSGVNTTADMAHTVYHGYTHSEEARKTIVCMESYGYSVAKTTDRMTTAMNHVSLSQANEIQTGTWFRGMHRRT